MKAVLSESPGGPETLVLRDVPEPSVSGTGVLIRVKAVGVNFPDVLIIEDKYQFKPKRPFSPGTEVSGVVEAVGASVEGLKVGDRVLAMLGWGGMAELVVAEAAKCIVIPDQMPFDEAAALILTYATNYYALVDRGGLKRGETLLVLGAAGGVGLAAIELGKVLGARVIAAASTRAKADLALSVGADHAIVYPEAATSSDDMKRLSQQFKEACGENGADIVLDPVGGNYAEPALRAIAWLGRYLVIGFPAGIEKFAANLILLKNCDVRGVFWGAAIERDPARHREACAELLSLYTKGLIRPRVSARFPVNQAGLAIQALASRRATGKVVVLFE